MSQCIAAKNEKLGIDGLVCFQAFPLVTTPRSSKKGIWSDLDAKNVVAWLGRLYPSTKFTTQATKEPVNRARAGNKFHHKPVEIIGEERDLEL